MAQNEGQQHDPTNEGMAMLLQTGDCPVGYRCLAMDCLKCLQIYMDQEAENNGT